MNIARLFRLSCLLALFLAAPVQAQPPQPMIEPHAQAMPLLPFLDYLIDESMAMDIEEVARLNQGWQPLALDSLPHVEGTVWLRFTIAPLAPDARPRTFLLDMGQSVPGEPVLYDPVHNELSGAREWRENLPAQRNILLLPEAGEEAIPCYIRLEGLPGPWFAPMIRTPQNAASNLSSLARTAGVLALAVIMVLCLLRGLGEKGQWRYWTALFVGVALIQAILGMPGASQHFSAKELAAILCPGLALMFLPHVGRHLMRTREWSRSIDIQLFLLSLPGAVLAVLPLAPGWNWLCRWLDLWPLGTLLFVPTALGAWLMAIPGSRRFLLACILPPFFVAFSLFGMEFGLPANLLSAGPIWAIAISALLLAAMRAPKSAEEPESGPTKKKAPRGLARKKKLPGLEMPSLQAEPEDQVINLEMPLDDPNLRLIPSQPEEKEDMTPVLEEPPSTERQPQMPAAAALEATEAREVALWKPVDDILRQAAALEQCSLPPSAREAAEGMKNAAQRLGAILSGEEVPETAAASGRTQSGSFNLQRVLRNAHDCVAAITECSGIALSWYMPPHLNQMYRGDGQALENTLRLLLESAVRCSRHGSIKVSARPMPGSLDEGHLLFTVTDDGHGYPPHDRSSLALAKAWELTGRHDGYLSVEASQAGAMIAFTARYTPVDAAENGSEAQYTVILASPDPGDRRQLARIIEAIPCKVIEVANAAEALACQKQMPSSLLVTQGRMARPSSADMVREFCRESRQAGIRECHVLAITTLDESQWPLLKTSGFTHAMLEPVDPEVLRHTVADLLKAAHENPDEAPASQPEPDVAALNEQAETETPAPTMLIDQSFPLRTAFEGPDWLGKPVKRDTAASQPAAPPLATPEPPADSQADNAIQPEPALEWVGEPMPITRPEKEMPKETPRETAAPTDALEWVGEPMPVEKPVTDFIVGVEPKKQNQSAVKDFMESSASLVSSTISGLLGGKGKNARQDSGQPPADGLKNTAPAAPVAKAGAAAESFRSSSDPEVMELLDRLDEQMAKANGFFQAKNSAGVATTIAQMAQDAEFFGLRVLTRMALCVERAARAGDMGALQDLLPELNDAVERNKIHILQKQGGKNRGVTL